MRQLIIAIVCCSLWNTGNAQTPSFEWAFNLGKGGDIYALSMILDKHGNIYTTGTFYQGPIDFDPGSDSMNLTSAGSNEIHLSKLDASGGLIWAKSFGGTDSDYGFAIAVDISGNVYFTGNFVGTADFDPGPEVYNLKSVGHTDIFICKLNVNGDFLWAKQIANTSAREGQSIAVDASNNVYITGYFSQTVDFDSSAETTNLTSNGDKDIFICKFNTLGVFQWVKQIGSTGYDSGRAIAIDNTSNIIITGSFTGTVDFNPGSVVNELTSPLGSNCFILKLNAAGNFVWVTQLGLSVPVDGKTLALDDLGNIYVAADGNGIAISKLNTNGNIAWSKLLPGSKSWVYSIAVDASGNVYSTGEFQHTLDFDPDANSVILDAPSWSDAFINKLDASGNYVWAYQIGDSFVDNGAGVALDASGNIYAYGSFYKTVDLDPGPNTFNLTSNSFDSYLLKWNQTTVGLSENFISENSVVYPNPASSEIQIRNENAKGEFKIFNIQGKLMLTKTITEPNQTINIRPLNPGIYIWEMENQNGKLVVQ